MGAVMAGNRHSSAGSWPGCHGARRNDRDRCRLFRGTRGGMLSESLYGRTWHTARSAALGPALADTGLARRPYDLRHAALSLWLNASAAAC